MKKILTLLFSILISFNSYADWTLITVNDDDVSYYIDLETIKEKGVYVYYWELDDFPNPMIDDLPIISAKIRKQIDCFEDKMKSLGTHYYEKNMGEGDIYYSDDSEGSWVYPPPGTAFSSVVNYVCDYVK